MAAMKSLPVLLTLLLALPAHALNALTEERYCGTPARTADGSIKRRADVLAAFRKAHPCPSTGKTSGACPGWSADHTISLACGGCDSVSNLAWIPNDMKSSANPHAKDRYERKIYQHWPEPIPGTGACKFEVVP